METSLIKKESNEKICYKLLVEVFITGSYSTITLGNALKDVPVLHRAEIARLFYGILEKSIQFDYILKQLTDKAPQKPVAILLKMGFYMLRFMNIPQYAAVDKIVKLSKEVGKKGVSGFINAVLRKSIAVELPKDDLSVQLSYPKWVIDKLLKRYSPDFIVDMLIRKDSPQRHIRHNGLKLSKDEFEKKLKLKNPKEVAKTELGYFVSSSSIQLLKQDEYTFQSFSSMLAVKAYLSGQGYKTVLDVCAAPGGKSIYLKELCIAANITANDVYPHRVELMKKYAKRMGAALEYTVKDASAINPEWLNSFDLVICDVPCSGFGVKTKPDILLKRKKSDIDLLTKVQYDILLASSCYVKKDGFLCYSTCTIFAEENEEIIQRFLQSNSNFQLSPITDKLLKDNDGTLNIYPADYNSDGFFIARLRRIK